MTVRLKDHEQLDRDEAEATRLLAVLSPSEPDPVMESRVYAHLMAEPERAMRRPARHRLWVLACVGLLLVSTTLLGATLVHRWLAKPRATADAAPARAPERATSRAGGEPSGASDQVADRIAEPAAAPGVGAAPPAALLPGAEAVPSRQPHTGTTRRRSPGPGNVAAKHAEGDAASAPGPVAETTSEGSSEGPSERGSSEMRMATAPSEEAALVLAALRALRRGHDPVKAGALLEQYLARFARGVLVEEALALGMEAALDRKDGATATRLADRYLQHYPAGRFTSLARRAMGSQGP